MTTDEDLGKTVAIVYYSTNGAKIYARRGGDHYAKMVDLAGGGERIPSLTEALEQLRADGTRRVMVQPTHLLYGYEYDKIKAIWPGELAWVQEMYRERRIEAINGAGLGT